MLILDDLAAAPFHGLFWIFRKIQKAARAEIDAQAQRTRAELGELYRLLESGAIDEEEFDRREGVLLDRLEALERARDEG